MWWNNVETKPGSGYPSLWEDQEKYRGGFIREKNQIKLKANKSKLFNLANIFFNPNLPTVDDYYEPFNYQYEHLFEAKKGDVQPVAKPISMITGDDMHIEAGPNWDDDLSGTKLYARNDVNLKKLSKEERHQLFCQERIVIAYLPRICNHCLNPACVASCPSGAIYKRGEDGIVLINQNKCRAWRQCVSGCPYKKSYYNWETGKSEKCILCYPRQEIGQAPACFHSCVGRIRYIGVLLYDADRIEESLKVSDDKLVESAREMILDPFDPKVINSAKECGLNDETIIYAQKSPVYKFYKKWRIALPLHPEFRTLPTLFYAPPLLPIQASFKDGTYDISSTNYFAFPSETRLPISYLASLFSAGNNSLVEESLKKIIASRYFKRFDTVCGEDKEKVDRLLKEIDMTKEDMEDIYRLTSLPTVEQRFVIPPLKREMVVEKLNKDTFEYRKRVGFGFIKQPKRG
jgi:nitrate reductase beta subunit